MKRLLCLVLAFIMAFGCLASCGGEGGGDVTYDSTVSSNETEAPVQEEKDELIEEETIAPVELEEYDLSKFKIVYAYDEFATVAEFLRDDIKKATSIELEVVKDTTVGKDAELVFLVGETKREVSKPVFDYANSFYNNKVGVTCDSGRVQLIGRDTRTVNASIDYLLKNSVNNNSTVLRVPEKGDFCIINPEMGETIPKKTIKNTLRVVSNNILLQNILRSTERATDLFSAFMLMDADVYCLQEVDMLWHSFYKLDSTLRKIGYEAYPPNNTNARNPIFYKSEVFKVVDGGQKSYDSSKFTDGTYPGSSYNWVCLEHKESGKQLIVVSTHFIASVSHAGISDDEKKQRANTYREESARQLLAALDEIKKTYPEAACLVMGDFNNNCDSPAYKLLSDSLNSARDHAPSKVNMDYQTYLGQPLGKAPKKGSEKVLDHIFYDDGIDAKHYETVVSPYTYAYSDHVPVLFDFKLK